MTGTDTSTRNGMRISSIHCIPDLNGMVKSRNGNVNLPSLPQTIDLIRDNSGSNFCFPNISSKQNISFKTMNKSLKLRLKKDKSAEKITINCSKIGNLNLKPANQYKFHKLPNKLTKIPTFGSQHSARNYHKLSHYCMVAPAKQRARYSHNWKRFSIKKIPKSHSQNKVRCSEDTMFHPKYAPKEEPVITLKQTEDTPSKKFERMHKRKLQRVKSHKKQLESAFKKSFCTFLEKVEKVTKEAQKSFDL
ncbi:unnamed protein product [Moneuplotes crassus]|uniref:Uncharacterized protein n=1 Tax=Euplotes crassus TaxID=5936 RepID=A0AAD2CZM1_EUPCR|nr:unnamed protein product [Moneuplotes crassus]